MADSVSLGSWNGHGVSVGEVRDALARLRREGERTATRTSVVSLVAVGRRPELIEQACTTVHGMGSRHPGRTIAVLVEDGEPGLDAEVHIRADTTEDGALWSEEVVLTVRGPAGEHLDSLVEPFVLPDLPVAIWFVASAPRQDDPLADTADIVIVDSKELGDLDAYEDLILVSRRRTVLDLSWIRLTPWRLLLANLFEGAVYRPFVRGVRHVEVAGKPGPRHLLGGWVMSRLGLSPDAVELVDARHASFTITAEHDGRTARFVTERQGDERMVRASVAVERGPSHDELLPLPEPTLAWSMAEALSDLEGDPIYGEALEAAVQFAG